MTPNPMYATVEDTELNLNDHEEVRRWCNVLNVDEDDLRAAVMKVGNKLNDIEAELANHDITPPEDIPSWEEGGGHTELADHSGIADE